MTIRIFDYLPDLDCFVINPRYRAIADELGLDEWHPAVWIGRLFILDNDYGEHWFDNWDLREQLETRAKERGLDSSELMVIDPERFENGDDGPCHPLEFRKRFWTDVLKSLELDLELIFDEARMQNEETQKYLPDEFIADLETRIERIREQFTLTAITTNDENLPSSIGRGVGGEGLFSGQEAELNKQE